MGAPQYVGIPKKTINSLREKNALATTKPKDYLHNSNLLVEILKSQKKQALLPEEEQQDRAAECLTPELVMMLMELVKRFATSYRWRGYTWNDDMQGEALMNLCKVALKFNLEKAGDYPNPFGYYTQIVKRVFLTYIEREKKQGKIRDEIIEMSETDLLPSFARQNEEDEEAPHYVDLDGTKAVESDPRRRRRKKLKVSSEDNTDKMTDAEQARWLAAKTQEFLDRGGIIRDKLPDPEPEPDDDMKKVSASELDRLTSKPA